MVDFDIIMSGYFGGLEALLFFLVFAAAAVLYILKEKKEKDELKKILQAVVELKESKGAEQPQTMKKQSERNQVYLKESSTMENPRKTASNPIYKIVITGGPCGGKSTSLERIVKEMTQKGFRVFSVPQIPTLVVQAGGMILMGKLNMEERIKFQSLLIKFQLYAEDYFTKLAEMSQSPSIVLCDRGAVDPAAYVTKEEFQAIMDEEGWTWTSLRDRRYDRVIHLVTAALGAEKFYTLSNNNARSQGLDLARSLDQKTLNAWTGHPYITVCPNVEGESFDKKVDRAIRAVHSTVGLEVQDNRYEKFVVKEPIIPEQVKVEQSEIEEIFLVNDDERWSEDKIKRRGQGNSYTYQRKYRCKKNKEGDYPLEMRVPITALQYVQLRDEKADPNFKLTKRQRLQFIIDSTQYSIDVWKNLYDQETVCILRFPNPHHDNPHKMVPKFIEVVEQVREDPRYSLRSIAKA